jgi:hypothetical protein
MASKRSAEAITEGTEQGQEKKKDNHIFIDRADGTVIDLGSLKGLIEFQNQPFKEVLGTGLMHYFILARFLYAARCAEATLFHGEVWPLVLRTDF